MAESSALKIGHENLLGPTRALTVPSREQSRRPPSKTLHEHAPPNWSVRPISKEHKHGSRHIGMMSIVWSMPVHMEWPLAELFVEPQGKSRLLLRLIPRVENGSVMPKESHEQKEGNRKNIGMHLVACGTESSCLLGVAVLCDADL